MSCPSVFLRVMGLKTLLSGGCRVGGGGACGGRCVAAVAALTGAASTSCRLAAMRAMRSQALAFSSGVKPLKSVLSSSTNDARISLKTLVASGVARQSSRACSCC